MSSRFTFAGLAAGFIAICVIIGVMNGLQEGFLSDIIELESFHIIAQTEDDSRLTAEKITSEVEGAETAVRFFDVIAMIQTYSGRYHPLVIRGVEETLFTEDQGFIEHAFLNPAFDSFEREMSIIPSRYIQRIAASAGDTVNVILMGEGRTVRHVPLSVTPEITHTYFSSTADINSSLAFMPLETIMKANREREPSIGIKLAEGTDLQAAAEAVTSLPGITSVETWKERNGAFYSALMLEKYGMMILLSLIFLVVIINSKVSFEKYVFFKKEEIGILRSLGASRGAVSLIFQLQAFFITLGGTALGIGLGILTASYINEIILAVQRVINTLFSTQLTFLPYRLPVVIHISEILILAVIVLVFSSLNIYLAVRSMVHKDPLEILRYE
jgi:lipoprotein-releasing system permease protein